MRWLGQLFGQYYAKWCTHQMLDDAVNHVADYWPYLLLLACPVMHLFHHHGGHRGHAGHGKHADPQATKNE